MLLFIISILKYLYIFVRQALLLISTFAPSLESENVDPEGFFESQFSYWNIFWTGN